MIGGGPAGMMAAIAAANNGARAIILEKKENPGKKLLITGKGRCNFTSAVADINDFVSAYAGNGRFLYSALKKFSNQDLIEFFDLRGLRSKVERGLRVFPESDDAGDILRILLKEMSRTGAEIKISQKVSALSINKSRIDGVRTEKGPIQADAVIVATGGLSYPGTGSTGDAYEWARKAGHNIVVPRPALVPLVSAEKWVKDLQGLSLRNVRVSAFQKGGRKIGEEFGEMLFTHFGVSGPVILSMSRDIGDCLLQGHKVTLFIDLKPALSEEKLDGRLCRDLAKNSRKQLKNSLNELLPQQLIPVVVELSGINKEKPSNQVNHRERKALLYLLKHLELNITATRSIAEAIVTAGGVDVREINPRTMESRLIKGLFFAGEVLDIDGYTGGYNLQAAFSTGFLAGSSAALVDG